MIQNLFYRILLVVFAAANAATATEPDLDALRRQFEQYSGARLVFARAELPSGRYYDVLEPLAHR